MDLSKHNIQYGIDTLCVLSLHETVICWTSNHSSQKGGRWGFVVRELDSRADILKLLTEKIVHTN